MSFWLLLIPFISAFIGWLFTCFAIKLLFRPLKPKKVFGLILQGLFPKRQQEFAKELGLVVSKEFSFSDLEEKITAPEHLEKIMPFLESHIDHFLKEKLGEKMPMIKMFVGEKTLAQMKEIFMDELKELFPLMIKNYICSVQSDFDFEKVFVKKVADFPTERLESILYRSMATEFRFIKMAGAVMGFMIGLMQVLITLVIA